jgi:hypothetical protein
MPMCPSGGKSPPQRNNGHGASAGTASSSPTAGDSVLPFPPSGGGAFLAEGGAGLFWEMDDGALLFRGSGGFLDVAAGGGALFSSRHCLLTFLFLSGGGGFLRGAGAIGFGAFAGGGVGLPR